jgi:hypothetical protein
VNDGRGQDEPVTPEGESVPTPISFKVMVVLAVLYLLYRLVQGVVWLFQALSG